MHTPTQARPATRAPFAPRPFARLTLLAIGLLLALPAPRASAVDHTSSATTQPGASIAANSSPATPDPTGASLGGALPTGPAAPAAPAFSADLAPFIAHHQIAINLIWTLLCGFLVMFMQAGFALVETGLCRAKNAAHTMSMNFMIYPVGMLGFYVCGFALMYGGLVNPITGYSGTGPEHEFTLHLFGHDVGLFGTTGFFLANHFDVGVYAFFLFQVMFLDTTATIPTGACAERWKFSAFMLYGCFVGTLLYPIYGNWVWGGGWLTHLGQWWGLGHGALDCAGGSVVHLQGGVIALVGAWFLGPRIGKYNGDGSANAVPAHSITLVLLGTFILAFSWFGFNGGSTLSGNNFRIAIIVTNTMLSSATGAVASCLWMWLVRTGKPDPSMFCNGLLAGLVAITAPCAYVTSAGACVIGAVAGLLVIESVFFLDRVARIDDPVGAISVHAVCGLFGFVCVGLFADGTYGQNVNGVEGTVRGLLYGGGVGQLGAQLVAALACIAYVAPATYAVFYVIEKLVGNRPAAEFEIDGLDVPEMGLQGYMGVAMDKASETPLSR